MNGAKILAETIEKVVDGKIAKAMRGGVQTVEAEYVGTDSQGKSWVLLPGADSATPVKSMAVEASAGDVVSVTIGNGRATVSSNVSNPGAGVAGVSEVRDTATVAKDTADKATVSASQALNAAATAQDSADRALVSADNAAEAAARADTHAEQAMQSATVAGDAAGRAQASASIANDAANAAIADAAIANHAANEANVAANGAVRGLATVEDVIGTLNWIAEHGTYVQTQDAHIDPAKVYYTRSGSGTQQDPYVYAAVEEPTDAGLSSYYELSIDSGIANYVNTHLALMGDGLHVVPTSGGYYLVIANDGVSVYDSQSNLVTKFGESIDFSSTRPQYIGNEDAYVVFVPADGSNPARVEIGGNVRMGSDKTLSEVLEDVQQASSDASDAVATARDGAHLVISSTNGQLFKNGSESTVLQVSVFPNGGGRLDTIETVRSRFGNGAYVEWKWKHDSDNTWGTLAANDPHISMGGMWLTVTPEDVASKTSFSADLVVP